MRTIDLVLAALLLLFLAFESGCIGLIGGRTLTADQIAAMKQYNDQFDVYVCGLIEGGTRDGNVMFFLLPKDMPAEVSFSQDCRGVVKTAK